MSQTNDDTFLSRIFGLNSVYAQLHNQDTYTQSNYYDDNSLDLEANLPNQSIRLTNLNDTSNLLASDSNSDSSSESDQEVPPRNNLHSDDDSEDVSEDETNGVQNPSLLLNNRNKSPNPPSNNQTPAAPGNTINWNLPNNDTTTTSPNPSSKSENKSIKFNLRKPSSKSPIPFRKPKSRFNIPPKERALYLWANIINMDEFLTDVYYYYQNKGLNNILLSKIIDLIILGFILWITVFLTWGVNYQGFKSWNPSLDTAKKIYLDDLIIPNYFFSQVPFIVKLLLLGFSSYIGLRAAQLYLDYKYKLREIQNFYYQLIQIKNDDELMTISWVRIIEKIMELKNYNSLTSSLNFSTKVNDLNSKIRLNPHDIANRIMRKENYFIALINNNVIDLSINSSTGTSSLLTKTLEWNLKLCIFNFIFNENGQINPQVLKDFNRNQLSQDLNKRFKMAAVINLILSPFLVIYFVLIYFFKYFNEYRINPSSIVNLRQFTPYAEWKLREFNELPHFFNKRLKMSYNPSNNYINQFPSNFLLVNIMYLVNFISGALTAILVIMGLLLEDENHNFWSFELTENRSVLFYISILGTIFALTTNTNNSNSPGNLGSNVPNNFNSNTNGKQFGNNYYDPEASIKYVAQFTHYLPKHWKGKLHTQQVKNEYCQLFKLKILIILNELLSILLTPFLLWFQVSSYSSGIIDFFRNYSIHIDGLGYICYFSMFNFEQKDKNMMRDTTNKRKKNKKPKQFIDNKKKIDPDNSDSDSDDSDDGDEMYRQDDKMIKSYRYFLENYQPETATNNTSTKPATSNKGGMATGPSRFSPNGVGASRNPNLRKLNQSIDPSNSLIHEADDSDLNDSIDPESANKLGRSGVLGMLNQFYRQDINKTG